MKASVLHHHRTGKVGNLQPTLFLQGHIAQLQAKRGVVVIDGVDTDADIGQVYMVIVQSFNVGQEILVVL